MPARDWRLRISDILDSIAIIQAHVAGMDHDSFAADQKSVDAVAHRFTTIGEAANVVPREIAASHPEIPWKKMREMRNVMVHVYFRVNTQILWETIREDLPSLVPLLERLLQEHPEG